MRSSWARFGQRSHLESIPALNSIGNIEGEFMKKKIMWLSLLAVVLMVTASSTHMVLAQSGPKRIEITAKRFSFEPGEITLKKGEPVILVIKSADVAHGLRFRELNVDINVRAGGTAEAQFTPGVTGNFVGHCSVFCGSGHGSMALKLHVVE
jgi:cytochrome c oxidase subunit 2